MNKTDKGLILVSGATGAIGSEAVKERRRCGREVRAMVHREDKRAEALRAIGAETVVADLLDPDSVRAAVEGVTAAYFVYRIRDVGLLDATAFMAQAAKEAGVKAIVNMS